MSSPSSPTWKYISHFTFGDAQDVDENLAIVDSMLLAETGIVDEADAQHEATRQSPPGLIVDRPSVPVLAVQLQQTAILKVGAVVPRSYYS